MPFVYRSHLASPVVNSSYTDSEESEDEKKRNNNYFSLKDEDDYN